MKILARYIHGSADRTAEMGRALYEEYSHDRKAVAMGLKGNKLSYVGFEALRSEKTGRAILMERPLSNLKKLVKPYSCPF